MKAVMSTQGRLVLPAKLRRQDNIHPGDQFEIQRLRCGEYRLQRCDPAPNEGLIDWLLACPHKGYFVPIASESTNTL